MAGYELLSLVYKQQKHYPKALYYYTLYKNISDSLLKETNIKNVTTAEYEIKETQLRAEQKEKELRQKLNYKADLQSKNYWMAIISICFILGIMTLLFVYRQNRLSALKKNIELEQRLLRSQMNPHFIFNSLDAIQTTIIENKPTDTIKYLTKFSRLLRQILENSREEYISLEKELETLQNYLTVQQLLYPFDYSIVVDENIDQETTAVPPMIAQPFIENALKHGFSDRRVRGNIYINFKWEKNKIIFEVADNGIGITRSEELKTKNNKAHKSLATEITRERLANILKINQEKVQILITELRDNSGNVSGTRTSIELPYIQVL